MLFGFISHAVLAVASTYTRSVYTTIVAQVTYVVFGFFVFAFA